MGNPCMNNYAAGDGRRFWIVGLEGDRHWPPLCRAVGRPEWLDDPRFSDARARFVNAVELIAELDAIFATRSLDEWAEVFAGEPDFFWSPVNSLEDVVADEQFHAAGGIVGCAGRRIQRRDGGHTGGFPRHTLGAAFCGTGTRAAHRGSSRRTEGSPRRLTRWSHLYKFPQKCHAVRWSRVTLGDAPRHSPARSGDEERIEWSRQLSTSARAAGVTVTSGSARDGRHRARAECLRYRLDVVAASAVDAVHSAGGWLYDRAMAGWEVTVLLPQSCDSRPLRILGVGAMDLAVGVRDTDGLDDP